MAYTNIQRLRLWLNDKDPKKYIFTDIELNEILSCYEDEINEKKKLDLARADCLEMIATDIRRWNSYTIGGISESTTMAKSQLLTVAQDLRAKWSVTGSDLDD